MKDNVETTPQNAKEEKKWKRTQNESTEKSQRKKNRAKMKMVT